jgi:hypothetical protein
MRRFSVVGQGHPAVQMYEINEKYEINAERGSFPFTTIEKVMVYQGNLTPSCPTIVQEVELLRQQPR